MATVQCKVLSGYTAGLMTFYPGAIQTLDRELAENMVKRKLVEIIGDEALETKKKRTQGKKAAAK